MPEWQTAGDRTHALSETVPRPPAVSRVVLNWLPVPRPARNQPRAMSESSRRAKIEALLAEEPGDQFLRYGLAVELDKEGEHDRSLALLAELGRDESPYVPAFFLAGQQLARLGRIDAARTALRDGIEHARAAGDAHAAGEMSEFLASLGALGE